MKVDFVAEAPEPGVPIGISFTTSEDGRYTMERQVDGGAWAPVNRDISRTRLAVIGHSTAHSYRYRVSMLDWAGNPSPWTYGKTFQPAHYREDARKAKYHGAWSHVIYVATPFVTARATAAGAYAAFSFTGKGIAWEALRGPKKGKATVYIDGKKVRKVDLKAKHTRWAVAFSRTWAKSGKHTIRIKVLGTHGRPQVDIDGFGVLR